MCASYNLKHYGSAHAAGTKCKTNTYTNYTVTEQAAVVAVVALKTAHRSTLSSDDDALVDTKDSSSSHSAAATTSTTCSMDAILVHHVATSLVCHCVHVRVVQHAVSRASAVTAWAFHPAVCHVVIAAVPAACGHAAHASARAPLAFCQRWWRCYCSSLCRAAALRAAKRHPVQQRHVLVGVHADEHIACVGVDVVVLEARAQQVQQRCLVQVVQAGCVVQVQAVCVGMRCEREAQGVEVAEREKLSAQSKQVAMRSAAARTEALRC
jgi:hypothetical protein